MKCLVIIPAYNEEKSIFRVVTSLKNCEVGLDILVINDGSRDLTSSEARRAGAKVVDLPCNLGIGGAVQTGYLYAYQNNYDIAIQFDGDGQHDCKYIGNLIYEIEHNNKDIVVGSRFIEQSGYVPSFFRGIGIKFFSYLMKIIGGKRIYDTTSGYRAMNKKAIELFVNYYPKDYPEVETIAYAMKKHLTVKEIPVCMNYRTEGKSSITPFKSIYYMVKVTFSILLMP